MQMLNLGRVLQSQAPRYRSAATARKDPCLPFLKRFRQSNLRDRRTTQVPTALSPEARLAAGLLPSSLPGTIPEFLCSRARYQAVSGVSMSSLGIAATSALPKNPQGLRGPLCPSDTLKSSCRPQAFPWLSRFPWSSSLTEVPVVSSLLETLWRVPVIPAALQPLLPLAGPVLASQRCQVLSLAVQSAWPAGSENPGGDRSVGRSFPDEFLCLCPRC